MAAIVTDLRSWYDENILPHADPKSRHWLLLNNSPGQIWILSLAYLLMVWLGPKLMKNRKPYNLQTFMIIYNFSLVALSLYVAVEVVLSVLDAEYDLMCAKYNKESREGEKELRVAKALWWYFISKPIELIDTLCMILRKKNEQISFLHVFHHCSMLSLVWVTVMFLPGGMSYFGAWINSTVHVVMYAYYGLAAIPSMRKKLWWKKYITKLQLTQFVVAFSHYVNTVYQGCDYPRWGSVLLGGYTLLQFVLFLNFYLHAYIKKKNADQSKSITTDTKHASHINGLTTRNGISCGADANAVANENVSEKKAQ